MTENKNIPYGPEELRKEPSQGGAGEIRDLINKGKYQQAELLLKSVDLEAEERAALNRELDMSLREIAPGLPKDVDISFEQAQKAVKNAEDEEILKYGERNMPGIGDLKDLEGTVQESNQLLDEILGLVNEAKSNTAKNMWAKPVGILALPVIADIYALIKGNKLRKQLKRLEELNQKLQNPNFLNSSLKADKISPNMGHKLTLAGAGTIVTGAGVAVLAANPVGIGIGAGLYVAGGITALAGTIKQIIDFANMYGTSQSLKDLEEKLLMAREQNTNTNKQINLYKQTYVQGARENLQPMMA